MEGDGPLCCCAPVYQWPCGSGWERASVVNLEFSGDTESTQGIESTQNLPGIQAGLVAQAYQVFPSDLPSGELGYHLLHWSLLHPSVLKVSVSRNNTYWIVSLGVKA